MKYLSDYQEEKQSKLFEETKAFFAFGQKQFDEKKQPGVDYVHLFGGLICPKENAKQLADGLNSIYEEAKRADFAENGNIKIIEREYFNHEIQISMDKQGLVDLMQGYEEIFPGQFTEEIILKVCKDCFKKAVENDWF